MSRRKRSGLSEKRGAPAPAAPASPGAMRPPPVKLICVLLAVITLGVFAPACGFNFLDYDDNIFITENSHVQGGFTRASLAWAFSNNDAYLWHPVTWLSHMLDFRLHGLKAAGHHFTSILIHTTSAVLLLLLLRRMTGAFWRSALVAALFAWHPLHVESVAWIAERKDVLSCFFWLLTLWSYCRYVERPGAGRYALVLLGFALGLMSKPMVVTLPCAMLLLDVWPLRRIKFVAGQKGGAAVPWRELWKLFREKIPMFALVVAVSAATVRMMDTSGGLTSTATLPLSARVANALFAYVRYLGDVFWPVNLSVFYPFPADFPVWLVAGCVLLLLGISFLAVRAWRDHPWLAVGWFWFLGTLVPTIGLVQNGNQSMADRYTYIPYIGAFIALAWSAGAMVQRRPEWSKGFSFAAGAVLLACLALTSVQLQYWRDTAVLFGHSLKVTENNFIAHTIYADAMVGKGRFDEAADHYRRALAIVPGLGQAVNNLANTLYLQGKTAESEKYYRDAVRLQPRWVQAHVGLATVLASQGKTAEAIQEFQEALRCKPDNADAHAGLGMILGNQGRTDDAIFHYREALRRQPGSADSHGGLGMALALQGKYAEAEAELRLALNFGAGPGAHNNLGNVLVLLKRPAEAIPHFRAALGADSNWTVPLNSLARLLAISGDPSVRNGAEALQLARRLGDLTRNEQPVYLNTLADAYAETGQFAEAIGTAEKAIPLAAAGGQTQLVQTLQQRLQLYANRQAFHEPAP